MLRRIFATLSLALNRVTGGEPGQTLCARIARRYGDDCAFCRVVAFILREPRHCWDELINDIRRTAARANAAPKRQ